MSTTTNLGLNKHDNVSTNENEFDIDTYLNANWDNLDTKIANIEAGINKLDDRAKSIIQSNVDANNFVNSGFYYLGSNCSNVPTNYIRLIVNGSDTSGDILQIAVGISDETAYFRMKKSNSWKSWKQLSEPVITTGVEFKTGRIIDGKEEYGKMINFGALPNATSKSVSIGFDSNTVNMTKIEGFVKVEGGVKYQLPYISQMGNNNVGVYVNGSSVWIWTQADRTTNTAIVTLYYTKNS